LDVRTALRTATKSFGATTDFGRLRHRPTAATLRLLSHRLDPSTSHATAKAALADALSAQLDPSHVLGSALPSHHWLLVVSSNDPGALQQSLLANGFDAVRGISNLGVVTVPEERPDLSVTQAADILRGAVVVPLHPDYSPAEVTRLTSCLRQHTC
jgi:hypothetical protein